MTAMLLLTANNMCRPWHENLSSDSQLFNSGLQNVSKMVQDTNHEGLRFFRDACIELDQEAHRRSSRAVNSMGANNLEFLAFTNPRWKF